LNLILQDLLGIDTSLVFVPKYKDLSEEEKQAVDEYYEALIELEKDKSLSSEKYKSIVKYSDDIRKKSDVNTAVLMHLLSRLTDHKPEKRLSKEEKQERAISRYLDAKINKEEFKIVLKDIQKTRHEAVLKTVALERYSQEHKKKKYDLLGFFRNAEALKKIQDRQSIANSVECVKIAIKNMDNQSQAVVNVMRADEELIRSSNQFVEIGVDNKLLLNVIGEKIYKTRLKVKEILTDIDYEEREEIEDLFNITANYAFYDETLESIKESYFDDEKINDEEALKKFEEVSIPILSEWQRKLDEWAYEHKDDYKRIIQETNQYIDDYIKNYNYEFNEDDEAERKRKVDEYYSVRAQIVMGCKYYLREDEIQQMDEQVKDLEAMFDLFCAGSSYNSPKSNERSLKYLHYIMDQIEKRYSQTSPNIPNRSRMIEDYKSYLYPDNPKQRAQIRDVLWALAYDTVYSDKIKVDVDSKYYDMFPIFRVDTINTAKDYFDVERFRSGEGYTDWLKEDPQICNLMEKNVYNIIHDKEESDILEFPKNIKGFETNTNVDLLLALYKLYSDSPDATKTTEIRGLRFYDFELSDIKKIVDDGVFPNLKIVFIKDFPLPETAYDAKLRIIVTGDDAVNAYMANFYDRTQDYKRGLIDPDNTKVQACRLFITLKDNNIKYAVIDDDVELTTVDDFIKEQKEGCDRY